MKVIGIDPGLSATGYGVVERIGNHITPLGWGVIRSGGNPLSQRLERLYGEVVALFKEHSPEVVAVEDIFTGRNPRTSLTLGHARGVVLLAAAQGGYSVQEYPTATVKQAVVGYGRASKQQVGYMVLKLLGMSGVELPEDASDALAVALCSIFRGSSPLLPPRKPGGRVDVVPTVQQRGDKGGLKISGVRDD